METFKIQNLTFTYPQQTAPALSDINLTINAGDFVVLCGKSGCGKSTLLRRLKPMLAPHGTVTGNITFCDREIQTLSQREQTEQIGFVLQSPDNQIVCDTVWHELAFGLENLSCSTDEIRARVAEMASFFGIQSWFYKNVNELSGGQKQLLNLAAVMVLQPSVLILDEPTSQLDPIAAHDFLETLSKINKDLGTTVILSEHRLEEALPLADKVIVLESGKVLAKGTPREVGQALKAADNDMLLAFPTPMRVFYAIENGGECPITVREGRRWLSKMELSSDICFEEKESLSNAEIALEMNNVYFRYEKNLPDVLKGLSLKVYQSEFYALVGGNGTGKTTALSVIARINRPYRGKVTIADGKRVAALPQNPQTLFARKTIWSDLYDVLSDLKISQEEKEQRINDVIRFCELEELAERHPFDLSGGEQQRAALAMILLLRPDILVLDEPTKGMDAHFKAKLAGMLRNLQENGMTIIMVSHDVEFCAKYADRCGMIFDGQLVSENTPRKFFAGKSFYTTAANRMARSVLPHAVLDTDITAALGVKARREEFDAASFHLRKTQPSANPTQTKNSRKLSKTNIVFGILFALAFAAVQFFFCGKSDDWTEILWETVSIVLLGLSCMNFIPQKQFGIKNAQMPREKRKIAKRTAVAAVMVLILIPLTILAGVFYFGDRKYYFISLLIILEIILPFVLVFEGRKPQARELVIISVLCAIAVAGRAAFAPLPQFKPVAAIVIIAGICFGGETGFLVGAVTGLVSGAFFGQGPWTPWQMFSFGIIGFFAGVLFQKGWLGKTKLALCLFGFFSVLILYGGIMNPATVLMMQTKPNIGMFLSAYLMGLPFDLIHAVSTVFFLWFAAEPLCEKLERIKAKYGLAE